MTIRLRCLWICLSLSALLIACTPPASEPKQPETKPAPIRWTTSHQLDGTWFLTQYLDSIAAHRSIMQYYMLPAAAFAITIEIRNDSILQLGSIFPAKRRPIIQNVDSLFVFGKTLSGAYLLLQDVKKGELRMKQIAHLSDCKADTITYNYSRRSAWEPIAEDLHDLPQLDSNLAQYFNQTLIAGNYTCNGQQVQFSVDGKVSNFRGYERYSVDTYFGTCHYWRDQDALFLSKGKEHDVWAWKWQGDTLILTQMYPKKEAEYALKSTSFILQKDPSPQP